MTILQFLDKETIPTKQITGVNSYTYNEYTIHYLTLIKSVMVYKGFNLVMEVKKLKDLKLILNK